MKKHFPKTLITFFLILSCTEAWSLMEISGNVGYDRQVFGANRQNNLTSRTFSGALAIYLWEYTALELNASTTEETNTSNDVVSVLDSNGNASGVSVVNSQNVVETEVYGIGIRQALATRKSRIRPLLSLGYARQFIRDRTDFTFADDATGSRTLSPGAVTRTREDSVFASFTLQFRLTRGLSVNASASTVFPAFELDNARDSTKYLVGFTWAL